MELGRRRTEPGTLFSASVDCCDASCAFTMAGVENEAVVGWVKRGPAKSGRMAHFHIAVAVVVAPRGCFKMQTTIYAPAILRGALYRLVLLVVLVR